MKIQRQLEHLDHLARFGRDTGRIRRPVRGAAV
jgi:hypothetical protein